jgi:hypothetical protein
MKRARRYAARILYFAIYIALTPIAIIVSPLVSLLELGSYCVESLEVIANDE